jgi:hypothetical protein
LLRARSFIGCSVRLTSGRGNRLVGARIQRDEFNIEISEDFERAEKSGLIRHPADQGRPSISHLADLEALNGRDQSRAQSSFDQHFVRARTHFDSFQRHDDSVPLGHVGIHSTQVGLGSMRDDDKH